jgi:hypothetical protein
METPNKGNFLKYNSMTLGVLIFLFGFLKFFNPFHGWFDTQITKSGLPDIAFPMGMAGEMSIGLALFIATKYRMKFEPIYFPIILFASLGLMLVMSVAIYVHLQPAVPAEALPLGIKPPIIPGTFMIFSLINIFQLIKNRNSKP